MALRLNDELGTVTCVGGHPASTGSLSLDDNTYA